MREVNVLESQCMRRMLQLKSKTNPMFALTASTSISIDVSDLSRISCIRRMSYRCTICNKSTNNITKVFTLNISISRNAKEVFLYRFYWPTVLSVEPLVQCLVCLSSVCRLSVTFCIVAKRCVLAKKCLKEWIENQGQRIDFLGRRHISTSGFAATATETAVFALFLPV